MIATGFNAMLTYGNATAPVESFIVHLAWCQCPYCDNGEVQQKGYKLGDYFRVAECGRCEGSGSIIPAGEEYRHQMERRLGLFARMCKRVQVANDLKLRWARGAAGGY